MSNPSNSVYANLSNVTGLVGTTTDGILNGVLAVEDERNSRETVYEVVNNQMRDIVPKMPFVIDQSFIMRDSEATNSAMTSLPNEDNIPLKKRRFRNDETEKASAQVQAPPAPPSTELLVSAPAPQTYALTNGVTVKQYAVKPATPVSVPTSSETPHSEERSCSVESRPESSESSSRSSNDEMSIAGQRRRQYNRIPDEMKTDAHKEQRKRNADAVARCRVKKKQQEEEMMKKMQDLEKQLKEKEETIKKLQLHNDFLMTMQIERSNGQL